MEFELRTGNDVAATLVFRSAFGSFATGRCADGCWTFKRVGFWQTRATIRECEGEKEIGAFRNNTWNGGGELELPDGRRFRATTNLWQSKLEFLDGSDNPLIELRSRGVIHMAATVEIQPPAVTLPEMPWMVLFGCYLTVMMRSDGAAAAAG